MKRTYFFNETNGNHEAQRVIDVKVIETYRSALKLMNSSQGFVTCRKGVNLYWKNMSPGLKLSLVHVNEFLSMGIIGTPDFRRRKGGK